MKINWRGILPHIAAIVIIVILNISYFSPQLNNKVVAQSDIVQSRKATSALKKYNETNDKIYLWNPSQFGGMPVLAGAPTQVKVIYNVYSVLRLGFSEPMGLYIAGCIMCYFLLILLGVNPWIGVIFSIAMVLTTSNIILWEAGHNSKVRTLIFTPLLIAGVLSIFEKRKYLFGFILLSLGFALSFYTRHPQMTYYIMMVFMIYGFVMLTQTIKTGEWYHLGKGAVLVFCALILGLATTTSKSWSLYDYSKATMRGESILKAENPASPTSSSQVEGLAWDYAMQWSNDHKDLMATYIPGFVGGGGREKVSTDSESFKNYRIKEAPLYWGQLPFTVGPMYLGASVIFLFILGLMWVRGNIKWWLGIGALWMLILSMGRNFEFINHLIFDYFPLYSKFRAPQSVLNTSSFFIALLSALALKELFQVSFKKKKSKKKKVSPVTLKSLAIGYAICGGIALFFALFGTSLYDFASPGDVRYAQQLDVSKFVSDRKSLMQGDAWRTFIIVSLIAGAIWAYMKNKINKIVLTSIIGIIVVVDIIGVDLRYLAHDDYVKENRYDEYFEPRPVDQMILASEPDRSRYRIQDLTIDAFSSSEASVFHNTVGGYSAVKMQRVQDLIDQHLAVNNMQVYNMLNTKYFIVQGQDQQPTVQRNPGALGVGWFVGDVQKVNTPQEEIDALKTISTAQTAVVLENEFPGYFDNVNIGYDSTATIEMTSYEPDEIIYRTQSAVASLAVFSEMWYGPDKGWQAYLNGTPVEHIRVNFVLRGLAIPAGNHEVKFEFRPRSFYTGEKISMASSWLLLLLIGWGIFYSYRKNKAPLNE